MGRVGPGLEGLADGRVFVRIDAAVPRFCLGDHEAVVVGVAIGALQDDHKLATGRPAGSVIVDANALGPAVVAGGVPLILRQLLQAPSLRVGEVHGRSLPCYAPNFAEVPFSELRPNGVLGSSQGRLNHRIDRYV